MTDRDHDAEQSTDIDATLSDARAVLADITHHTDEWIIAACIVLECYGEMPERDRAIEVRHMIETWTKPE